MGELGEPTFEPLGDGAVRVGFGTGIDTATNARVRQFCRALEREPVRGVTEWVPGYVTVAVYYQPWVVRYGAVRAALAARVGRRGEEELLPGRVVEIPVRYGGEYGPDLEDVAAWHGVTVEEVVARHTGAAYGVYFLGFAPGFAYLGGLPEDLATPRLEKPRVSVPAGSVGIGGAQTGVYPLATPGGWRIIGRTSVLLYDVNREPPALLQAGDEVRFVAEDWDAEG